MPVLVAHALDEVEHRIARRQREALPPRRKEAFAPGIAVDTLHTIDEMFPEPLQGDEEAAADDARGIQHWYPVPAPGMGYIEGVDLDAMLEFARERGVVVRMEQWMGGFCTPDRAIASIGAPQPPDEDTVQHVSGLFAVDSYRTIEQDVAFGIRQLVDVALAALSPANTDPTTAVTALDHLSVVLQRLAGRRLVPQPIRDGDTLRVLPAGPGFEHLLALAFDQILESAHGNTVVLLRMLEAIEQVRAGTMSPQRLAILDDKRETIAEVALRTASCGNARRQIEARLAGAEVVEDTAGA